MSQHLRAYEMVETTTPDEVGLMKQQRRIEEAQRLRRQKLAGAAERLAPSKQTARVEETLRR